MTGSARSEDAIIGAVLELVAEHGVGGFTVDAVAARAGVGKQTIYRHWGSRARLVHAAISCMPDEADTPDTGSLRDDLTNLLEQLTLFLSRSDTGRVLPSLIDAAERDPELAELRQAHIQERRAVFAVVLGRGIEREELPGDADVGLLTDMLVGPLFYRRIIGRRAVATTDVAPIVDLVLRGVGAALPV